MKIPILLGITTLILQIQVQGYNGIDRSFKDIMKNQFKDLLNNIHKDNKDSRDNHENKDKKEISDLDSKYNRYNTTDDSSITTKYDTNTRDNTYTYNRYNRKDTNDRYKKVEDRRIDRNNDNIPFYCINDEGTIEPYELATTKIEQPRLFISLTISKRKLKKQFQKVKMLLNIGKINLILTEPLPREKEIILASLFESMNIRTIIRTKIYNKPYIPHGLSRIIHPYCSSKYRLCGLGSKCTNGKPVCQLQDKECIPMSIRRLERNDIFPIGLPPKRTVVLKENNDYKLHHLTDYRRTVDLLESFKVINLNIPISTKEPIKKEQIEEIRRIIRMNNDYNALFYTTSNSIRGMVIFTIISAISSSGTRLGDLYIPGTKIKEIIEYFQREIELAEVTDILKEDIRVLEQVLSPENTDNHHTTPRDNSNNYSNHSNHRDSHRDSRDNHRDSHRDDYNSYN
ncbi:hypothetical protein NEOKW01_1181 [Nematocida sp. AWRm80]|nr:hypothetical protein NEOKW01_1181 [Nematocida sp. AWRm80]